MHTIILFAAQYLYFIIAAIAFVYWLRVPQNEKIRLIVFGAILAIVTFALTRIGSVLYYNPRPFMTDGITPIYPHAPGNGFPSDHTALTAFIALTIFSSSKRLGTFLLVLAVVVGSARVIGHIHSPIDIIGSVLFATVGYGAAWFVTPKIIQRIHNASHGSSDTHKPSDG